MVRAREETQEGVRRRRRRVRCRVVRRVGPVVGIRAVEGRRAVGEEEGGGVVMEEVVVLDAVGWSGWLLSYRSFERTAISTLSEGLKMRIPQTRLSSGEIYINLHILLFTYVKCPLPGQGN